MQMKNLPFTGMAVCHNSDPKAPHSMEVSLNFNHSKQPMDGGHTFGLTEAHARYVDRWCKSYTVLSFNQGKGVGPQ